MAKNKREEKTWPPPRGDPLLQDYLGENYWTERSDHWPFSKDDMKREDEEDDEEFYTKPRFSRHVDEWALLSLRTYYGHEIEQILQQKEGVDVLDLCSSWMSHLPEAYERNNSRGDNIRVVGVGMNAEELEANPHLTAWHIQDLNESPHLEQFDEASFDLILLTCSVDYLTQPREVFQELQRLLRPGGVCLITFSNRCFPSKAVRTWLQSNDVGRRHIVASYFYWSSPNWQSIQAIDIRLRRTYARLLEFALQGPEVVGRGLMGAVMRDTFDPDPLFAIKAVKKK